MTAEREALIRKYREGPGRIAKAVVGLSKALLDYKPADGGWSNDFSQEPLGRQGFFIHEMTHVWQAQAKGRFYLPLMRHPFCRYAYRLKPGKPFERYGLEQQAEIVAHRFLADHGARMPIVPPRELLPFL